MKRRTFSALGRDLFLHFECDCPMRRRITLSGYADDHFFDVVNRLPRVYECDCGKRYSVQWFRDGVELKESAIMYMPEPENDWSPPPCFREAADVRYLPRDSLVDYLLGTGLDNDSLDSLDCLGDTDLEDLVISVARERRDIANDQ